MTETTHKLNKHVNNPFKLNYVKHHSPKTSRLLSTPRLGIHPGGVIHVTLLLDTRLGIVTMTTEEVRVVRWRRGGEGDEVEARW